MSKAVRKMPKTDAASVLEDKTPQLLETWSRRVRQEIPALAQQDNSTLFNSFPEFVDILRNVISTTSETPGGERYVNENRENCRKHGTERARMPAYTLDQVIQEYKILREVLFDQLENEVELTRVERGKLLEAIDNGIIEAASEFAALRGFSDARIHQAEFERHKVQSQLNQSRSEVDNLNVERKLREQFVSTLSHDLRTPLTAVKASAELILRQADDSDMSRRLASRILDDIARTDRMIRDLLDANRIRAGERLSLTLQEFDLSKLIRETLQGLASVHGERFEFHSEEPVKGYWSPLDLRRVIENLVQNGLKYGDPLLPVTLVLGSEVNKVRLSVHNEGSVISSDEQKRLFEPFSRVQQAKTGGKRGWGLGLTLVKGITEAHGGTVSVESLDGRGTTFTVELPRDARPNSARTSTGK